jgi:hypothetical protein
MADPRSQRAAFYTEHLGEPLRILPAKRGEDPPIEVFVFAPTDDRDHYKLITSGVSDAEQPAPPAVPPSKRYVEVMLYLEALDQDPGVVDLWPVTLLRSVAQLPARQSYLAEFKLAPLSTPAKPIAEASRLTTPVLLPPMFDLEPFQKGLTLSDGRRVSFLWLDVLTTKEAMFLSGNGAQALLRKFQEKQHTPLLDANRESYV